MHTHHDVIVIGSGAGGAAAAHTLARRGLKVLILEKGGELPKDGSTLDLHKVIRMGAFKSAEPWLDRDGRRFVPEEYFNLGGKTRWYGAALLRFAPHEFEADPDFQCPAWPIGYEELEPWYGEAETLLGVRTFEPEPDLAAISARLTRNGAGWRALPLPLALDPAILEDAREASRFDAFASVRGLKFDALRLLERSPTITVLGGRTVSALLADPAEPERVAGVVCADGGVFRAGAVVLAAGALHSPRLVQDYFEITGLDRRLPCAGRVGRGFKRHLLTAMLGFSAGPKSDRLRKTQVLLNDRFPHSSAQPLGFDAELIAALLPGALPRFLARGLARRAYGFFLQTEDGSHPDNRVLARVNGCGWPQLDYDTRRLPAALAEHRQLVRAFQRALLGAGLLASARAVPLSGTAHACGTLAAGADPRDSVVDGRGRVHGMDNLYVADGSVLPRSSRVNPSLTIYAWGLRLGAQLQP